jgi:predicted transcriptional regulator
MSSSARSFVIMSIRRKWAERIFAGRKFVELRRSFADLNTTMLPLPVVLYISSPVKAIYGKARISRIAKETPTSLWPLVSDGSDITLEEFSRYFHGSPHAFGLFLEQPVALDEPVTLAELRHRFGFTPPVSWRWARESEQELLR